MLAEFIREITGLSEKANSISSMDLDDRTVLYRCGDTVTEREKLPKRREVNLQSLASFVDFAGDHLMPSEGSHGSAVYVSVEKAFPSRIRFYFDQHDRRDHATLELERSAAFEVLIGLSTPVTPKQLVKILRTSLSEAVVDPAFINVVRKIDFSRKSDGSHTTEHGRESMGKSVENQVRTGGGDLPEIVGFDLPMFSNDGLSFKAALKFALFIDFDNERISLEPVGTELEEFVQLTQRRVMEAVTTALANAGNDIEVYLGSE